MKGKTTGVEDTTHVPKVKFLQQLKQVYKVEKIKAENHCLRRPETFLTF
jgi:hypothetical protein